MKILLFSLFLFTATVSTAQTMCSTHEVRTEITIHAPVDSVWSILINTDAYPSWNPYIYEIRGTVEKGEMVHFRMKGNPEDRTFSAKILAKEPNREFAWGGSLLFFIRARHYFILTSIDANTTLLVQGEYWKGLFGTSLGKKVYEDACVNFAAMNVKVKEMAEMNVVP